MGKLIDLREVFETALEANGWELSDAGVYVPPEDQRSNTTKFELE